MMIIPNSNWHADRPCTMTRHLRDLTSNALSDRHGPGWVKYPMVIIKEGAPVNVLRRAFLKYCLGSAALGLEVLTPGIGEKALAAGGDPHDRDGAGRDWKYAVIPDRS